MTIYVVGTCQTKSLAACLQVMIPDVRIEQLPADTDLEAIGPEDLVFRQRYRPDMTPARHGGREITSPVIWFNAFHPDVVYLVGPWGSVTPPLGGGQHSSLALYGWHRGLSAARTAKLFTEAVFEKLHFFDCWEAAKHTLIEEGRDLGLAFDAVFARVERFGCFMHSPIHPTLVVMAELARELVRRAGLTPTVVVPESYLEDPLLRGAVWPVYPEIGRHLGL
ncbi:MAG TPA: WcbI family polysaccharide biosynthesis putative acetyltransferase, partial [Xanthomonadales bacterium]|nr:WcbI family polysaccharide biosynthesis putative acetyltransferase [Xanthomonadales bacterium]